MVLLLVLGRALVLMRERVDSLTDVRARGAEL